MCQSLKLLLDVYKMLKLPLIGLYIHIPWCIQKCPYCDFNAHQLKGHIPHKKYVEHLLADLDSDLLFINTRRINSIFIGGGTPSLLSSEAIWQLLDGINTRLKMIEHAEITIEVNPGSIVAESFRDYQQAGINRISIGVQSFSESKLKKIGRTHGPKEAKQASILANILQFRNINLDLMYGLPDQSYQEAINDLYQAIALDPKHISWYQLTIEPNTSFNSRPPKLPNEDLLWAIFQKGQHILKNAGYQQYETSSYTKPGYQCQHNLNYWRFGDYIGIGCGSHGKITYSNGEILRTVKKKHPRGFMQGQYLDQKYSVIFADRPFEFFMNRFRLFEEVPRIDFYNLTGLTESKIRLPLDKALEKGYLLETKQHWKITEKGKLFLNSLLELFL